MIKDPTIEKILLELTSACRAARKGTCQPKYPKSVKKQVLKLIRDGFPAKEIMKSTGLSDGAIRKWLKSTDPIEPIRVLPIIDDKIGKQQSVSKQQSDLPILKLKTKTFEIVIYAPAES